MGAEWKRMHRLPSWLDEEPSNDDTLIGTVIDATSRFTLMRGL